MRLERLPLEPIGWRVGVFKLVHTVQFAHPKIVHGSLSDVITAEDIHPTPRNQNKIIGYKSNIMKMI